MAVQEQNNLKTVQIYTDGACSGNPGMGGWGAVLLHGNKKKEISGGKDVTTNNQMELTAVIEGLKALKKQCKVEIYSDSAYVINAFEQNWIENWQKNNWKNSQKKDVLNKELWQELYSLVNFHKVSFHKVKGHSGNFYNERCDELATAYYKNKTTQ